MCCREPCNFQRDFDTLLHFNSPHSLPFLSQNTTVRTVSGVDCAVDSRLLLVISFVAMVSIQLLPLNLSLCKLAKDLVALEGRCRLLLPPSIVSSALKLSIHPTSPPCPFLQLIYLVLPTYLLLPSLILMRSRQLTLKPCPQPSQLVLLLHPSSPPSKLLMPRRLAKHQVMQPNPQSLS